MPRAQQRDVPFDIETQVVAYESDEETPGHRRNRKRKRMDLLSVSVEPSPAATRAPSPSPVPQRGQPNIGNVDLPEAPVSEFANGEDDDNFHVVGPAKGSQSDYVRQFVERAPALLQGLLAREALSMDSAICPLCTSQYALWRCQDCTAPAAICRGCMRRTHRFNPLHRVERWNGKYFEPMKLWQAGCYLLIPHHEGVPLCDSLLREIEVIENHQSVKDAHEQEAIAEGHHRTNITARPPINALVSAYPTQPPHHTGATYITDYGEIPEDARLFETNALDEQPDTGDMSEMPHYMATDDESPPEQSNTAGQAAPAAAADASLHETYHTIYVRVVHTTGIHNLGMISCQCRGRGLLPVDLMASHFVPASFEIIKTLFTVQVLDGFRISNLELKASAYQFYNMLRRITSPLAPGEVVDLHNEFRRMSRLWRWLKKLKWAGYGHNGKQPEDAEGGELTPFCPACPQVDINLPADWQQRRDQWMYRRVFVADGNFKADHVRAPAPSRDIWLIDGAGIAPQRRAYQEFLRSASEMPTRAPCERRFKVIQTAKQPSNSCDVPGVVGVACSRHGCFCPNTLVDLVKGEQQKNVDFALLQAIRTTGVTVDQGVTLIYDIACQYSVHLFDRIGHLLPPGMKIDRAIGMFHVHGHKDECFFRFAPSFIPGAAITSGEIMEHLWGGLNGIAQAARTATNAHRAEILDEHASDSNWKKALSMAKYLCGRHKKAVIMCEEIGKYFAGLTANVSPQLIHRWTVEISAAEAARYANVKAMDIYIPVGQRAATSQAQLLATTRREGNNVYTWLEFALIVEEHQIEILDRLRRLGRTEDVTEQNKIDQLRDALKTYMVHLTALQRKSGVNDNGRSDNDINFAGDDIMWDNQPSNAAGNPVAAYPPDDRDIEGTPPIERQRICLPSNGNTSGQFTEEELELRLEQAEKHLTHLRELIADKSFQYSALVRTGNQPLVRTRARTALHEMNAKIAFHARMYNRVRCRLVMLGADNGILHRYRLLQPDDIAASTAILNYNEPGSTTSVRLSWIWQSVRTRLGPEFTTGEVQTQDATTMIEFKRVHWLRGRALSQRWNEENQLVDNEMEWTVRYFLRKAKDWEDVPIQYPNVPAGAAAYAARQSAQWQDLAARADILFAINNSNYESPL